MSATNKKLLYAGLAFLVIALCSFIGYAILRGVQFFYTVAVIWICTVVILLWYGNKYLFSLLDLRYSWLTHTSTRFFVQLFLSCSYSLVCINLTYYLFKIQTSTQAPELSQFLVLNVYGLLFIIPVISVNFSSYFVMQWKAASKQTDLLREENLRTQLKSLRMQLDPHFLFNNLNVLSALIEKDQRTATDFLDKFADVYRYVLQYKTEELVPLETELEFVQSYAFLLEARFGEKLQTSLPEEGFDRGRFFIPPLSLQLLIENALKHNSLSGPTPFVLNVNIDKNCLVVSNTLRPRAIEQRSTESTGLESIRRRYEVLSDRNITISRNDDFFIVSLPLLEISD